MRTVHPDVVSSVEKPQEGSVDLSESPDHVTQTESEDSDHKHKEFRAIVGPVRVGRNLADVQGWLTYNHIDWESDPFPSFNKHPFAAACRYAMGTKTAQTMAAILETSPKYRYDFIVMWPRRAEMVFYPKAIASGSGEDRVYATTAGYRLMLDGTDWARGGRIVYPTKLEESRYFISHDGILYYWSPELAVKEFADHPGIDEGITILASSRPFLSGEGKVWLENYHHPEYMLGERTEEVKLPRPLWTRATTPEGVEIENLEGKPIQVRTKTVKHPSVSYAKLDAFEGVGWTLPNGKIEYHASSGKTGDSVYTHELNGDLWFTSSQLVYGLNGDVYTITIHQEGAIGPYVLLQIHIKRTTVGDDCPTGLLHREPRDRPDIAYVKDGVIPSLLEALEITAGRSNLENGEALRKLHARELECLMESFGKRNWEHMAMVKKALKAAIRRTMDQAVASLEREQQTVTFGGQDREAAKANVEARVEASGLGGVVAGLAAELSVKQTRLELILGLLARLRNWVADTWNNFWKEKVPANIAGATLKIMSRVEGRIGSKTAWITRATRWLSGEETSGNWADYLIMGVGDIIVPVVEELLKRWAPWPAAFIFGAIEGLLVGLDAAWDCEELGAGAWVVLKNVVSRSIAHGVLRLIPLWMSVPGHISYNVSLRLKRWMSLFPWMARWLEVAVDEIEMVEVSKHKEYDGQYIYHKDVDGTERPVTGPLDLPLVSRRQIILETPCTDQFIETCGTLRSFLTMITERMEAPLEAEANCDAWDDVLRRTITFVRDLDLKAEAYTFEECHTYVDARPWPQSLKDSNHASLVKAEDAEHLSQKKHLNAKKEVLVGKQELGETDGDIAGKTRPIHPAAEVDVELMRIAVPLKKVLTGTFYATMTNGSLRFYHTYAMAFASSDGKRVAAFTYAPSANTRDRSRWMNDALFEDFCWHVNQYGDDHVSVLVWLRKAFAVDFARCDRTCRTEFHDWFHALVTMIFGGDPVVERLMKLMRSRLIGEFKLVSKELDELEAIYYAKAEEYTNTGEYLTAIKALCSGFSSWLEAIVPWLEEKGEPNVLLENAMSSLGFIPEFEKDYTGNAVQDIPRVTFLGGRWCETADGYQFYNAKFIKAYTIFPDTPRIYGPFHHIEAHMRVLLADPDLYVTPDGRSLARWYKRCVDAAPTTMSYMKAHEKWIAHLGRSGAGRYELEKLEASPSELAPFFFKIDLASWTRHVESVVHGVYGPQAIFAGPGEVIQEIDELEGFPNSIHTADYWYVLRYGKSKVQNYVPLAPLNIVQSIFALGEKIISHFYKKMTKTLKQDRQKPKRSTAHKGDAGAKEVARLRKEVAKLSAAEVTAVGVAASYAGKAQTRRPKIHQESGATVIKHTELIKSVTGTAGWGTDSTIIQPGLAVTFPWLSQIAASFEQYRFRKLTFKLMTCVGTTTGGNIYLIPDYDAGDSAPPSEDKGLVNQKAKGGVPWNNYSVTLNSGDLHPNGKRKFTRHAGLTAYSDIRNFDAGVLYTCFIGCPTAVMARLFVEYEIELYVPQYDTTTTAMVMAGISPALITADLSTDLMGWVGLSRLGTTTEPLGVKLVQDTNSSETVGGAGNYLFFHDMVVGTVYKFVVRMWNSNLALSVSNFGIASMGNVAYINNAAGVVANLSGGGWPYMIVEAYLAFSATEGFLEMTASGSLAGAVSWWADVMLVQVPAALAVAINLPHPLVATDGVMTCNGGLRKIVKRDASEVVNILASGAAPRPKLLK